MGFPLLAGSSLPVTWRRPELELPLKAPIQEALIASRGELEIFGIHALEALQCMVERRTAGQQGVKAVTCLEGDAVWKAGDAGLWSWDLLEHALGRSPSLNVGDIRENCRHFIPKADSPTYPDGPAAFIIEYRDGLKATVLLLNGHVDDTTFAARIKGQEKPASTLFYLPPPPGAEFLEALDHEGRRLSRPRATTLPDRAHAADRRNPRHGARICASKGTSVWMPLISTSATSRRKIPVLFAAITPIRCSGKTWYSASLCGRERPPLQVRGESQQQSSLSFNSLVGSRSTMMQRNHRREFLADVGRGMLIAGAGYSLAVDLGLSPALAEDARSRSRSASWSRSSR